MNLQQSKHLLKVRMGYEITTSTGHVWTAVPTGWRDESTKLTWKYEDEEGKYTYDEAIAKFGEALPSKEEWETAEKHGIREVLDLEGKWLWSSSLVSDFRGYAWLFGTGVGSVNSFDRYITGGARCVGR